MHEAVEGSCSPVSASLRAVRPAGPKVPDGRTNGPVVAGRTVSTELQGQPVVPVQSIPLPVVVYAVKVDSRLSPKQSVCFDQQRSPTGDFASGRASSYPRLRPGLFAQGGPDIRYSTVALSVGSPD